MILRCDTKNTSKKKEKNDKLHFIKIQNFCASKDPNKKEKREPIEWEKIFISHMFDKVLVSRIYKECLQLNNKKTTQFKMGKGSQ